MIYFNLRKLNYICLDGKPRTRHYYVISKRVCNASFWNGFQSVANAIWQRWAFIGYSALWWNRKFQFHPFSTSNSSCNPSVLHIPTLGMPFRSRWNRDILLYWFIAKWRLQYRPFEYCERRSSLALLFYAATGIREHERKAYLWRV